MAGSAAPSEPPREGAPLPEGETSTHVAVYTLYLNGLNKDTGTSCDNRMGLSLRWDINILYTFVLKTHFHNILEFGINTRSHFLFYWYDIGGGIERNAFCSMKVHTFRISTMHQLSDHKCKESTHLCQGREMKRTKGGRKRVERWVGSSQNTPSFPLLLSSFSGE